MTTFFTADLHFGHVRIIELCNRPFDSVEEMNETLVDNWNDKVTDEDIVWILGDLALGKLDDSLAYVAMLKGDKRLIPGNHDRVWGGYSKKNGVVKPEDTARYEAAGLKIYGRGEPFVHENGWTLCHFPDIGDSHDGDRFTSWRPAPPRKPGVIVHGHVHEKWLTNGPRINVGVDVWDFEPVSEDEVASLAEDVWG